MLGEDFGSGVCCNGVIFFGNVQDLFFFGEFVVVDIVDDFEVNGVEGFGCLEGDVLSVFGKDVFELSGDVEYVWWVEQRFGIFEFVGEVYGEVELIFGIVYVYMVFEQGV